MKHKRKRQEYDKKLLITVFVCLSFITLSGCGNKDILGTTFTFKYAKVRLVDGRIVEGEVKQWAKYDEQDSIRVTFENGEAYYTHSSNVTLYNKQMGINMDLQNFIYLLFGLVWLSGLIWASVIAFKNIKEK